MVKDSSGKTRWKNGLDITNYFKPAPRANALLKRSVPTESIVNTDVEAPHRTKSPRLDDARHDHPPQRPSSSAISVLTPIASDETLEPPSDLMAHHPQQSNASVGSAGSSFSLPVSTSSQRVFRNGEVMVTNSDEEDDSDSSLADVDEILKSHPRPQSSSPLTELGSSEPELPTPVPARGTPALITSRRTRSSVKRIKPPDKKYKFSMDKLLHHTQRRSAEDEAYEKALSLAGDARLGTATLEQVQDVVKPSEGLSVETLASKIKAEDPDDIDKLKHALQRTEALRLGSSWFFLSDRQMDIDIPPFPRREGQPWESWAENPLSREIAFLSGSVADVALHGHLPLEILVWLLEYCYFEAREDLRHAYFLVIERATSQMQEFVDAERLHCIVSQLGASTDALGRDAKIRAKTARAHDTNPGGGSLRKLCDFLWVMSRIARSLTPDARAFLLYVSLCIALDQSLVSDASLLSLLQNAVSACVDDETDWPLNTSTLATLKIIYDKVEGQELQIQLVRALPVSTHACCAVRRRFALAFFYKDGSFLTEESSPLPQPSQVAEYLRSQKDYTVKHSMDFQQLAASMSLLDISVDDGDRPSEALDPEREKEFNREVDELSNTVRDMFSRIVDAGASHMSRTEAKEVMVAFEARLQYAVRTKPRPKGSIFGDVESKESRNFMKNWVQKQAESSNER